MPETRSNKELNEPFLSALDEFVECYDNVDQKPLTAELQEPLPAKVEAYFYSLKRYDRDEDRFRIQPTSGPDQDDLKSDSMTILGGYSDNLERYGGKAFFALYDPTVYEQDALEASSPNRLVGEQAIDTAAEDGLGEFIKERESTNKAEFVLVVRPDSLDQALIKKQLRHVVRDIIGEELPHAWDDTYQKHISIEETVINFLIDTDLAAPAESRYQIAIMETVGGDYGTDLDSETVKSMWDDTTDENPATVLDRIERTLIDSNSALISEIRSERSPSDDIFGRIEGLPKTEELHFPREDIYETIDTALRSGKHLILTGSPGAGKSHLAEVVADYYADQYKIATATDDWTTFDTIGGYRQDRTEDLKFHPGVFLQRFLDPEVPDPKKEWLVVDELNRADIDKAFGSLFSALTGQNITLPFDTDDGQVEVIGNSEEQIATPLTDHYYYIPADWRLIATMNTDDKSSLYRLSYAFMRRFAFVHVPVPTDKEEIDNNMSDYLSAWNVNLQEDISISEQQKETLPEDFEPEDIEDDLAEIWAAIQPFCAIGPAMIQDVLNHVMMQLDQERDLDYGPAIAAHIIPQLEGTSEQDIKGIFSELKDIEPITMEYLHRFVDKYLGVQLNDE